MKNLNEPNGQKNLSQMLHFQVGMEIFFNMKNFFLLIDETLLINWTDCASFFIILHYAPPPLLLVIVVRELLMIIYQHIISIIED